MLLPSGDGLVPNSMIAYQASRLRFLDGLRGVAALAVVLYHNYLFLNGATNVSFPSAIEALVLKGHLGVQIFFVLSGFVIAYSIRNANFSWSYVGRFFVRRSIRLDPPYWIALFLMIAATIIFSFLTGKAGGNFSSSQMLANTFYMQQFFGFDSINPVAWTLCIELQLYLFFVLILQLLFATLQANRQVEQAVVLKSTASTLFFTVLFAASLSYHDGEGAANLRELTPQGLFFPYWYSFFIGTAVCWNLLGQLSNRWLMFLFGLMGLSLPFQADGEMATCFFTALTISGVGKRGELETTALSKVFQYLGRISFSLYLIHWLAGSNCTLFLSKRVGDMTLLKFSMIYLLSLGVSIFAAHLFYLWVETPCLRWSKQFRTPLNEVFTK